VIIVTHSVLSSQQLNGKSLTWCLVSCCYNSQSPLESRICIKNKELTMLGSRGTDVLIKKELRCHCMVNQS
jgi:hypothetical protein